MSIVDALIVGLFLVYVIAVGLHDRKEAAAGPDPREPLALLLRGVAATALSAITVFCLLIGLGTWLLDATPPAWLPYRGAWVALNLAIGMAVIPVWLRLGFKPGENTAK